MIQNIQNIREDIIGLLTDIRKDAGEDRIGTREVEIINLMKPIQAKLIFATLKKLREEGLITRSNGYCWIKPDGEKP